MKQVLRFSAAAAVLAAGLFTAAAVTPASAVDLRANYFGSDAPAAADAAVAVDNVELEGWEFTGRSRPIVCRIGHGGRIGN